ncbi:acyl-CoA dehydrogenase family protein [Rhodococcus sp. IEGM 1381]|uniref:acyl-CoA dehydrogenase family protein n=1 Tax=Rhodococcus sp. IEGM 1381 TaxID=3047085 RepID=UPI0024B64518|nr:acyl-CoA dehydrogenase family protein [Rhodococcus sp. IEGM 1381]MDI9894448.1 acyl-CoA dehydrogenase family protein [Rhodococcus sp. IEGM 1381]
MESEIFDDILGTVRTFIRKEVVPREEEIEETDAIPDDIRRKAASMGLFGYALPEEYGGMGFTMSEDVRLAMELGHTTPAFRSMISTNNGIAGQVVARYGTEEQKKDYLPRLASGELIGSFALTEADAGSDPTGLRTTAVADGDHYVLNGTKRYITNAPLAGVFMVFARTDPSSTGTKGISVLAVDADSPGLTVGPHDKKMGQSGAWTAELFFDNVRVPVDNIIGGQEGAGFAAAMGALSRGRLHVGALCVGIGERLLEESVRAATVITQGGRSIGGFQLVQAMLAESKTEIAAGKAMALAAAVDYDSGIDTKMGPSTTKLYCTEMVGRVADRAVQIHGGLGYMRTVPVERLYRDVRLFRIYEGTSEIQKLIIARQLLKDAPAY